MRVCVTRTRLFQRARPGDRSLRARQRVTHRLWRVTPSPEAPAAPNSSSDESESLEDEVSSQGRSADGSESISSLENRGYAYESASASSDDGFVSVCSDVDGAEAATVDAVTIGSTNAAAAEEVCEGEAVPQSAWQRQVE